MDREFPSDRSRRVLESEIVLVVDEFEDGERGVVSDAVPGPQDASVTSWSLGVPLRERREQRFESTLRVE